MKGDTGGKRFAGGERQRFAIARAILRDRAVLVVAHRLSAVERADRVVVLEHGRIVERGPHAELIAGGGAYARMHRRAAT